MDFEIFKDNIEQILTNLLSDENTFSKTTEEIMNLLFKELGIDDKDKFIQDNFNNTKKEIVEKYFEQVELYIKIYLTYNMVVDKIINDSSFFPATFYNKLENINATEEHYDLDNFIIFVVNDYLKLENFKEVIDKLSYEISLDSVYVDDKRCENEDLAIEKIVKGLSYDVINRLLNKNPEGLNNLLFDLVRWCEYENIIEELTEEELLEVSKKGVYSLIHFVPDSIVENLSIDDLEEFLHYKIVDNLSESKRKIISKKMTFKELIIASNKGSGDSLSKYYSAYDEIDKESFDYILEKKLFSGIYECEGILKNKEYIKKLIDNNCPYIILYLNEETLDDELFYYITNKIPDLGIISFSSYKNCTLFNSKKNTLKFANHMFGHFEEFLKCVKDEYLKEVVLFCTLNGMKEPSDEKYRKYYSKTLEDIKYAIDNGYKYSDRTSISTEEEVRIFAENNQPQAIDNIINVYNDSADVSLDLYKFVLEKGYKFSARKPLAYTFHNNEKLQEILKYCLENNHQDFILQHMKQYGSQTSGDQFFSSFEYICRNLYSIKGDDSFIEFLTNNNMIDEILDILIFQCHKTSVCVKIESSVLSNSITQVDKIQEDFSDIIKEKYENYKNIEKYIQYINKVKNIVINKDEINLYFSEEGPTKLFYSKIIFGDYNDLKNCMTDSDYFIKLYKNQPHIIQFVKFRLNNNINFEWFLFQEKYEISDYFDPKGPKKSLYDLALFNKNLFEIYKKNNADEIYSSNPEIVQFIKFRQIHQYLDYSYINTNNIIEYFDSKGPTKKTFDIYLVSDRFHEVFQKHDIYLERYNLNPEIMQYIKYRLSGKTNLDYYFIKENSDIGDYFDLFGPSKKLYEYSLYKDNWFKELCNNKDKYFSYFKDDKILLYFYQFRLDNPYLCFDIIKTIESIYEYFDEYGPKESYYKVAFESFDIKYFNSINNENNLYLKYKDNPAVLSYSKFMSIYGSIFRNIIKYEDIDKYFDESGYTDELVTFFENNKDKTKELLSSLVHNDLVLNNLNNDFVNIFKGYILSTFLNEVKNPNEMYEYLLDNLGAKILFNLENKNVKVLLKYEIQDLDILFALFDKDTEIIPNERVYSSFVQSLLTYKFKKENREIVDVFTNINSIITSMTLEEMENLLNNFENNKHTDLGNWIVRISDCLNLDEQNFQSLKDSIIECKKLNEQPLRNICRKYLEKTQKEYYETNKDSVLIELGLPVMYDKKDSYTKLYKNLLLNVDYQNFLLMRNQLKQYLDYYNLNGYIEQINLTKSDLDIILNLTEEEFDSIVFSIRNKTKPSDGKKFKLFKNFITYYAKYLVDNNIVNEKELNGLDVKRTVQIPLEKIDMISIINELNFDIFINSVGKNEKIVNNLKKLLSKYYIGRLPSIIGKKMEMQYNINLPGGINNIGLFITKYYQLLLNEQKNLRKANKEVDLEDIMFTFMQIVNLISSTNSETYELKRLLGTEEYLDFISNRGPNSGQGSRIQREEKIGLIADYLYMIGSVTIPTGDIIVESNNKKINFIIGNRTNPANICHGERTGACMRIGGVGEGLFLKCITDKNWFHIRIEDPETHEYVSRVSCFRNGNTVYFNQLRNVPAGCKYTNSDLQEFIQEYAKMLIEQTKDSEYPIENVFINTGYAMENFKSKNGKVYHLGSDIQKEYNINDVLNLQLRGGINIWTDVRNNAVLLATTKEGEKTDNGYAPLKNGPENTEIYPATRDKIYGVEYIETDIPKHRFVTVDINSLYEKINRVHCMKKKLLGKDYRYEIDDVDKMDDEYYIVDGYASSDWYVYIDNSNNIHMDFISEIKNKDEIINYTQKEEAQKEMEYFKQILINKYSLDTEVKYAV